MIDLHTHTNASDGKLTPEELIDLSIKRGLKAVAITDHDTIDSVETAVEYAKDKEIEFVPGIEISCDESENGFDEVHVVGLFIDYKNKDIADFSENIKKKRIEQKKEMIKKLQDLGFDITFEEVIKTVKGSFGRPHLAKILFKKYPDKFTSIRNVFEQYLDFGKPAYVKRTDKCDIKKAIEIIKKSKGIPVLGHPGLIEKEKAAELIQLFKSLGGKVVETYYPYNLLYSKLVKDETENKKLISFFQDVAKENNLLESGGSDFHGGDRDTLGKANVPYELLVKMKENLK